MLPAIRHQCCVVVEGDEVNLRGASPAWFLCGAQVLTTALAAGLAWALSGASAAGAAIYGGMVAIVPALFFALRIGLKRDASQAKEILGAFYQAELGKLLLTALLFFIGVRLFGKHFAPLLLTCMACLAMNWLLLAVARHD